MWNRSSLKFKLVASFLVISAFLLVVGGIGYWTLGNVSASYRFVAKNALPNVAALGNMRASAYGIVRNATIRSNPRAPESADQAAKDALEARLAQYEDANKAYLATPFEEGEEALYNDLNAKSVDLRKTIDEMKSMFDSKDPSVESKVEQIALTDLSTKMAALLTEFDKLRDFQNKRAQFYVKSAEAAEKTGMVTTVMAVVAGCLLSVIIGVFFATYLAKRFNSLASELLHGAEQVASASQQISSASEQLSAAAAEQAASLQETSASVEEISAMVNKNTENANQSRSVSEVSQAAADSGRKAVDQMIEAVQAISSSNDEIGTRLAESNREFGQIVNVINEIATKTKVINDIVFQTKLLSFNASVEAARAGEHGKGFAVVAEEVGNLAQMSGNAAKEISDMLENSTRQVEEIVQRTQGDMERLITTGKEKVEVGQTVAVECGQILEKVVTQVGEMNRMATEISSASTEQAQGVQEIGNAMRQLDQVTQQNASAAHQAASSSTELSGQAETLHALVEDLTKFVQGGSAGSSPVATRNHSTAAPTKKTKAHSNNVIAFKKSSEKSEKKAKTASDPAMKKNVDAQPLKMAVGSDMNPPLDSDPRFKDI